MKTAKLFTNGRSQAVRLPKEYRFEGREKEVYVHKFENIVLLIPKRNPWRALIHSLDQFTPDFMTERHQPRQPDSREEFA